MPDQETLDRFVADEKRIAALEAIVLPPPPPAPLVADFTFVANGRAVNFSQTTVGGTSPYTYKWMHGTTVFSTATTAAFAYQADGDKTVTLEVTDASGTKATKTKTFTVTATTTPPPDPPPSTGGWPVPAGWKVARLDDCSDPVLENLWGSKEAEPPSDVAHRPLGGPLIGGVQFGCREAITAGGRWQGANYERAEAGRNERRYGLASSADHSGTFYLYQPGAVVRTESWYWLPPGYPINAGDWLVIQQMKQAQPNVEGISSPILAVEARNGKIEVRDYHDESKSSPYFAQAVSLGTWWPLIIEATYSADPTKGKLQATINGKQSSLITTQTLAVQVGNNSGLTDGQPIPSHLRQGFYSQATRLNPGVKFGPTRVLVPS